MSKITFETALQNLEQSVQTLEIEGLTLEEALKTFEEGIRWSRECNQFLENAEQRIEMILKNDSGEYEKTAFPADLS